MKSDITEEIDVSEPSLRHYVAAFLIVIVISTGLAHAPKYLKALSVWIMHGGQFRSDESESETGTGTQSSSEVDSSADADASSTNTNQ